jgi:hypothetical protein
MCVAALLLTLSGTPAFSSAQIWDLGEGIAVGATPDGQVTCIRYGRDLNKTAIWSVQYGFIPLGTYTPRGITWKGSQLVIAAHLNGVAYRWDGNIQGVGTWTALPLADGLYNWQPHRVQAIASDGTNVWIVGYSAYTGGAEHGCVYTDNGSTSACTNIVIPSPGHDHSEMCAVSESGLVAGQAQYGGSGSLTSGGRQVITGSPLRFLGNILGGPTANNEGRALAISGDGSRIIGWSYIILSPLYIQQCYWDAPYTANKTAHAIPFLPGHVWGDATAISRTGVYIGGLSWKTIYVGGVVDPEGQEAWIWDAAHGTRDLKQVLIAQGADLTGWGRLCDDLAGTPEHGDGFFDISGISEDGRWIAGTGAKSRVRHAYVAYLNEAPTVSAVTPVSAPNSGTVQVTITGLCFRPGASVKLTRTGYSSIGAYNVTVSSLASITCSFNLTNKAVGQWDVVVTNTDGESGSLQKGLAVVLPASAPPVAASIRSATAPIIPIASAKFRFTFWGIATVVDSNTIQLNDGSGQVLTVLAPGHAGISNGHFARAVGTLSSSSGKVILLSSSNQLTPLN